MHLRSSTKAFLNKEVINQSPLANASKIPIWCNENIEVTCIVSKNIQFFRISGQLKLCLEKTLGNMIGAKKIKTNDY